MLYINNDNNQVQTDKDRKSLQITKVLSILLIMRGLSEMGISHVLWSVHGTD